MLEHTLDPAQSILYLRPKSALRKEDFEALARDVDPYLEQHGDLAGLIVQVESFPGWDSFGALAAHIRFVRDHHRRVRKVAIVTDAKIGDVAEKLASHFVAATIRHFAAGELDAARRWIARPGD
ncbi:MAG TPA: STAS/SEC14 domain-containing protein [Myxococcota bacterium]|nr:STAS/SEC14 domain-containing protein [Myxococcota bacterium]